MGFDTYCFNLNNAFNAKSSTFDLLLRSGDSIILEDVELYLF